MSWMDITLRYRAEPGDLLCPGKRGKDRPSLRKCLWALQETPEERMEKDPSSRPGRGQHGQLEIHVRALRVRPGEGHADESGGDGNSRP